MENLRKLISKFRPEKPKSSQTGKMLVHAVIKRADGTVEDLGLVAEGYIKDWDAEKFIPSGGN